MGFRTVTIKSRCKLETQLDYLVVRGETESRINMDEISTVIIANTQASMTAAAISTMVSHHIKIIFCDYKWNPQAEVFGLHENSLSSAAVDRQIKWSKERKDAVWKNIVQAKLKGQAYVLGLFNHLDESNALIKFATDVKDGDVTNREGIGAGLYFRAAFGMGFNRSNERDVRNTFLDYGYSIILSAVNREIAAAGYLGQIGLHHIGNTNAFNLGCDIMEPLRPFVDLQILQGKVDENNFKKIFNELLSLEVVQAGKTYYLDNAIRLYLLSVIGAMERGEEIKFIGLKGN